MRIIRQGDDHKRIDYHSHKCYQCLSEIEVDHRNDPIFWKKENYLSIERKSPRPGWEEDFYIEAYVVTRERGYVACPNCSATIYLGIERRKEKLTFSEYDSRKS